MSTAFLVVRTLYAPDFSSTHSLRTAFTLYALHFSSMHSLRTAFFVERTLTPYMWYYALSMHRLFGSTHSLRTAF